MTNVIHPHTEIQSDYSDGSYEIAGGFLRFGGVLGILWGDIAIANVKEIFLPGDQRRPWFYWHAESSLFRSRVFLSVRGTLFSPIGVTPKEPNSFAAALRALPQHMVDGFSGELPSLVCASCGRDLKGRMICAHCDSAA